MFNDASTIFFIIGLVVAVAIVIYLVKITAKLKVQPDEPVHHDTASKAKRTHALDFNGHVQAANELLQTYQFHDALAHLEQAHKQKPKDYQVLFKMGRVHLGLHDYAKARSAFKKVLALQSKHFESLFELAKLALKNKNHSEALEYIDTMLSERPDHLPTIKLQAQVLVDEQSFEKAETIIRQVLSHEKDNLEMVYLLGWVLYQAKKYDEAIEIFNKLLALDPSDKRNLKFYLYSIYLQRNEFDKAIDVLQNVMAAGSGTHGPDYIKTEFARCLCLKAANCFNNERPQDALICLQQAIEQNGHYVDSYKMLCDVYKSMKQWDKALEAAHKVIYLDPKNYQSHIAVATLYEEQNKFPEAIESMKMAEGLYPSAQVFYYLGTLYGMTGDFENCVNYLNKATRKDPKFVDAFYNLGVALEQTGELKGAYESYKKVIELDAAHEEALTNCQQLKKRLHFF